MHQPPHLGRIAASSALALALALQSGCYSFSSYQTAHVLKPDEFAVSPSINRFQPTDGELRFEDGDWSVELQLRAGIAQRADVGIKVSRIFLEDGYEFIAIDPKVALVPDRVAFSLPIGTFTGADIGMALQLHPTLVLSQPIDGTQTEFTAAAKALVLFDQGAREEARTLLAFNLGVRFNSDSARWGLHPEIGVLIDDDAGSSWVQAGLGVWVQTDLRKRP